MESISKFMQWEVLSLGGGSLTIGEPAAAVLTIAVVLVLSRWLIRKLSQRPLEGGRNANQVQLINRILWVALIALVFFTALSMLNVPLGAFAFISGAIAIGIGFGAQNIINNFISGWILMGERPIRIGGLLEVNDTLGRVEAINTRSTRIKRVDGVRIVIPNSHLLENMLVNWNPGDQEAGQAVPDTPEEH